MTLSDDSLSDGSRSDGSLFDDFTFGYFNSTKSILNFVAYMPP